MKFVKFGIVVLSLFNFDLTLAKRCGKENGLSCPKGYCCSKYGYCGKSVDYCGVGCQSKFGECNKVEAKKKSKTTTTTKKSSKKRTTSSKKSSTKKSSKKITTTSKSKKITTTSKSKKITSKKNKKTTTTQKTKTINSKESNISTNGKCGPKNGNKICPKGKCCSKKGYCGETDAYCKSGCQSEFGVCKDTKKSSTKKTTSKKTSTKKTSIKKTTSKKTTSKKTSTKKTSTKKTTTKPITTKKSTTKPITTKKTTTKPITTKTKTSNISRETSLISKNGKCGPKNGNKICPNNKCCSQYGYCGTSKAYCGKGCQSEFGKCDQIAETSKTKTTAKKTTTTTTSSKTTKSSTTKKAKSSTKKTTKSKTTKSSTKKTTTTTKSTTTTTTTTEKITSTKISVETNPISIDGTCGPKHGNKVCPGNECCGSDGKCAFNEDACGVGCQKEFGGYCLPEDFEEYLCEECVDCVDCRESLFDALRCPSTCASDPDHLYDDDQETQNKEGTTTTTTTTEKITSTEVSVETNPISTDGTCGPKHGNKVCPGNECCGSDGKCAFNEDACGVGCQKEFGGYCLPEDFEEYLCEECVDCVDCRESLFDALRCPSTCASDPDHLYDDDQETQNKEGTTTTTTTEKITSTEVSVETNPISTDGTCGPKHGNKVCPGNECCGSDGKCAFSNKACGVGCQKEFGGYCLPEDYRERVCMECVDCVDCRKNLFYALRCSSACASDPDHLDDGVFTLDYKEGEVAFITYREDGAEIYEDYKGNTITIIYPEDKEPMTTTKKTPTATATVASTLTSTSSAVETNPISTDGTCGPKHGNKVCPGNECCGSDGKCAFNNKACGIGCQKEFGGYCLPEDYRERVCMECVDCVDCRKNLFYALRCSSACASDPDHLDDGVFTLDYKEGEVAFITYRDDGAEIYEDYEGNTITIIYPEDKEPKTTTKKTPTATSTV